MRNYSLILAMLFFSSQDAISYPLNESSVLLKTRRFEFSPLFAASDTAQSNILFPSSISKSTPTVSSIASLSAGGTASHRSGSSPPSIEDDETHSVIGTLPPLPTTSIIPVVTAASLSSSSVSSYPGPTAPPTHSVNSLSSISTHEEKEWKVIGVGLIVIASIASMILLTVFFESWWGFVKGMCGRKEYGGGIEEMIPDSEEKSWKLNLSSEDGHRYPLASSMESMINQIQKPKSPYPFPITPKPLFLPPSYFRPTCNPHPLEPLFRRPSIRTPVITSKSPSMLPYS